MTANGSAILFAVIVATVVIATMFLHRFRIALANREMRAMLTPDLALKTFRRSVEDGEDIYNLSGLLKLYGKNDRVKRVEREKNLLRLILSDKRTEFVLREDEHSYLLERVEYYCDTNWQFQGWYTQYDRQKDHSTTIYRTTGVDVVEARKRWKSLPSFRLTEKAIKSIASYLMDEYDRKESRR